MSRSYPTKTVKREQPSTQTQVPQKRLKQADLDSSCYRLSRNPQKYNVGKGVKSESNGSYAVNYYQNSSEPPDTRPPMEKLEEINSKLSGDNSQDSGESNDQFELLVQKKMLCSLIYGEGSEEYVKAETELGSYYNQNDSPESALRHLSKAQQQAKQADMNEQDGLRLAVEYAEANFKAKPQSRQDGAKQISNAEKALMEYADTETDDKELAFRRDIMLARAKAKGQKWKDAVPFYERAADNYIEPDNKEEHGDLYVEAAICAEKAENEDSTQKCYKAAYEIYKSAGLDEKAEPLEEKIKKEEEEQNDLQQTADSVDGPAESQLTDVVTALVDEEHQKQEEEENDFEMEEKEEKTESSPKKEK